MHGTNIKITSQLYMGGDSWPGQQLEVFCSLLRQCMRVTAASEHFSHADVYILTIAQNGGVLNSEYNEIQV